METTSFEAASSNSAIKFGALAWGGFNLSFFFFFFNQSSFIIYWMMTTLMCFSASLARKCSSHSGLNVASLWVEEPSVVLLLVCTVIQCSTGDGVLLSWCSSVHPLLVSAAALSLPWLALAARLSPADSQWITTQWTDHLMTAMVLICRGGFFFFIVVCVCVWMCCFCWYFCSPSNYHFSSDG